MHKVYASLDVAKFIMAIMILMGHIANEWALTAGIWHYILSFDFTVPSFFAISGFLFFSRIRLLTSFQEKKQYYIRWSVRIGKMYLVWTAIYFFFILINWIRNGVTASQVLLWLMKSVTFSSYATIWFLPSLWVGVSICWVLTEKIHNIRCVYLIITSLWLVGVLMDPYKNLVIHSQVAESVYNYYLFVFKTFRNGVFYASAYCMLGFFVANKTNIPTFSHSLLGVIVFQMLFVLEALFMKKNNPGSCTDMAIMMLPSVYYILTLLLNIDVSSSSLTILLRKYSMLVFLGQRLFLTAIPSILPYTFTQFIHSLPQIEVYSLFTLVTVVFAIVVELLSRRFRIMNVLM